MMLTPVTQAAQIYRIPVRTLRRWVYEGRLGDHSHRAARTRSRVVIDLEELDRLVHPHPEE